MKKLRRLHILLQLAVLSWLLTLASFGLSPGVTFCGQWAPHVFSCRHVVRSSASAGWWGVLQDTLGKFGLGDTPLAIWEKLPCCTDTGTALARLWKEEGEDAFLAALQSELLSLRAAADSSSTSTCPSVADKGRNFDGEDDSVVLQKRMAALAEKERREQVFADLLHLGTVYRLQNEGMKLSQGVLESQTLPNALVVLPPAIASEVRDYVLTAVAPAALNGSAALRVTKANLAPLLMGSGLYGYFLARVATQSTSGEADVVQLAQSDWESQAAFVTMSTRVGVLLDLPPESEDPLQRYASLTAVTTEVTSIPETAAGKQLKNGMGQLEGGMLQLTGDGLRGLLGEICVFGFSMCLWEQKIYKFLNPKLT
eukprot:TRINITY_DN25994_c0_g1_i1.p1 TRINITY_DN25994_c0_g1~~TRINITY_DN25994_c0_g1_i1.p1  ORF type:complete len:369 (-),score=69.56 TRINITY_DN25994_c0_g1_i1:50-1156(-)